MSSMTLTRPALAVAIAIAVFALAGPASAALLSPALDNASFESGSQSTINGWSQEGDTFKQPDGNESPSAPAGSNWLLLYGNDGSDAVYQQFGTFEANEQYDLSFTLGERTGEEFSKENPFESVTFDIRAGGGQTTDTLLATSGEIKPGTFDGTGQTFTDTITLTPDQGLGTADGTPLFLRIQGGVNTATPSGRTDELVDDLSMTASIIPEPATLALLGLGGAVMLSGRKRRSA